MEMVSFIQNSYPREAKGSGAFTTIGVLTKGMTNHSTLFRVQKIDSRDSIHT